jgi:hypothetical protein
MKSEELAAWILKEYGPFTMAHAADVRPGLPADWTGSRTPARRAL